MSAAPSSVDAADDRTAVFHVHGVSKVYRMGEIEVHALRGVDLDLFAGELVGHPDDSDSIALFGRRAAEHA